MRYFTGIGPCLGLLGLAVIASPAAWADPPRANPPADAAARPRRSLFHKPHLCAACQRADLQAKGINVPPPPPLPPGGTVESRKCDRCGAARVASMGSVAPGGASTGMVAPGSNCVQCANPSPVMMGPNGMPMSVGDGGAAPGYAAAGGDAPGYVVVGGTMPTAEPMPIGMVQGRYASQAPGGPGMPMPPGRPALDAGARGPGSGDPSVMPTSYSAEPYVPSGRNRPHVLTHLFGLDAIGQRGREERRRRERETHAAISYQPQNEPVTELPASMVYGR